jgi:hypothetical protein
MSTSPRIRQNTNNLLGKYLVRAAAAGVVVVLAGCGNSSAVTAARPTAKTTSSPEAAPSPAFLPQLNAMMLRPTDLPKGWLGTPHKVDPNAAANNAAMAKCVGGRDTNTDQVAEANSADSILTMSPVGPF